MRGIFLAVMLAGFAVYAGMNLSASVTPYVSIAEATAATGSVQVKGLRDENFEPKQNDGEFIFNLRDEETGEILPVKFSGVKPDQFDEAYHVVAVGKYDAADETFHAKKLLINAHRSTRASARNETENIRAGDGGVSGRGERVAVDFNFHGRFFGAVRGGVLVDETAGAVQNFGVLGGTAGLILAVAADSRAGWSDFSFPQNSGGSAGGLFRAGNFAGSIRGGEESVRGESGASFGRRRTESAAAGFLDGDTPADNFRRIRAAGGAAVIEFGRADKISGVEKLA